MNPPPTYLFGIVVSFLLAGLLAFLGLVFVSADDLGWGAAALLTYALLIGGPLAVTLGLTWLVYVLRDRGRVPGRVHALMIVPTLLAALIVPVHEQGRQNQWQRFGDAHPAIREVHINLSGGEIGLDTRHASSSSGGFESSMSPASAQGRFNRLTRYPSPDAVAEGSFAYDGARLKPDVQHYVYRAPDGSPGASLPLQRLPYPEPGPLQAIVGTELLVHHYFHFGDRVEVAPGVARFAATTEDTVAAARLPGLVLFSLENADDPTIFRAEVNGQTLDLGGYAVRVRDGNDFRCRGQGHSAVLADLAHPIRVRWQVLERPGVWQAAQVTVPAFSAASQSDPATALSRVRLYVLPDRQVVAERYREIRRGDRLSVRTTGLPAQAAAQTVCGGAFSVYNPQTVALLRD